ncbi:MAG: DUF2442 domain-containing protein [Flavobacteriaceae bacterium]|jgi:hypothetical protein|nr:DUF2442 domain-containing protein [Flavobacteriaceae bacterium]
MYIGITSVVPQDNYILLLTFENGEQRCLDMKPYLHRGVFKELVNKAMFNTVRVSYDTVAWKNEIDLAPEILYEKSVPVNSAKQH